MAFQPGRAFGWVAIASIAYHALAMVLLHALVPGVNPMEEMVGAYLSTPYALLSRTTFVALGCALAALGAGLAVAMPPGRPSKLVTVMLVLSGLGFVAFAAFPDPAGTVGRVLRPFTLLSIVIATSGVRRHAPWRSSGFALVVLAVSLVAAFAVTFGLLVGLGLGGLANRVVLVLIYAWSLLVARGLALPAPAPG